jgi:hypothetical protein
MNAGNFRVLLIHVEGFIHVIEKIRRRHHVIFQYDNTVPLPQDMGDTVYDRTGKSKITILGNDSNGTEAFHLVDFVPYGDHTFACLVISSAVREDSQVMLFRATVPDKST